MTAPRIETVRCWLGRFMIDRDGNRIGEITDIYLDNETGRPEWAVVRTGLFGLRSTFVPLAEAIETGEQVQVRHRRGQIKDAPNIEPDGQLSAAEEAELYRRTNWTMTPCWRTAARRPARQYSTRLSSSLAPATSGPGSPRPAPTRTGRPRPAEDGGQAPPAAPRCPMSATDYARQATASLWTCGLGRGP